MFFRPEITALQGYQPGEQPKEEGVVKLNTNENPYPASDMVYTTLKRQSERKLLARYPDPLATSFRDRAADILDLPGPDWILCGNGADDLLTIVTRALVSPGQYVRLPYPSYILYETLARIQGAKYQEIQFRPADWSLREAFADEAVESLDDLRLVFLPNPNSPSGTVVGKEVIRKLASEISCPLLIDEAYVDFAEEDCLDLVRENEKIMVLRSMSKGYSLAGLRFGFLVAQPHLIEQFLKVKDSYNCDTVSIAAATSAITDQQWREENRRKIIATRQMLTEGMREMGFEVPDSQANFIWNTHPEIKLHPIFQMLRKNHYLTRYMVYSDWGPESTIHGKPTGEGLRISVGTEQQIEQCLALIRKILHKGN